MVRMQRAREDYADALAAFGNLTRGFRLRAVYGPGRQLPPHWRQNTIGW